MEYFAVYAKNRITGETIIKKVGAETTEDATLKAKVTMMNTCGMELVALI